MMVVLAFTTLTMSAQDAKWTVYAGLGMSSIVGSDSEGNESAFSYKIGINYDITCTESFSIIPGVEFVNKAHKEKAIDGTINAFYVQVPVLLAYKFNINDDMKLAVKAGPYAAYGVAGSDIMWYGSRKTQNLFDVFERFDAGIQAGVSLDLSKFTVGVEYTRGFTKVVEDEKCYNQGFGLTVGYKF